MIRRASHAHGVSSISLAWPTRRACVGCAVLCSVAGSVVLAGCARGTYNPNYRPNMNVAGDPAGNVNRNNRTLTYNDAQPSMGLGAGHNDIDTVFDAEIDAALGAPLEIGNDAALASGELSIEDQVHAANESGFDAAAYLRDGTINTAPSERSIADAAPRSTDEQTEIDVAQRRLNERQLALDAINANNTHVNDAESRAASTTPASANATNTTGAYLPDGKSPETPTGVSLTTEIASISNEPEKTEKNGVRANQTNRADMMVALFDATTGYATTTTDPFAVMLPIALLGVDKESASFAHQLDPLTLNSLTPEERTMLDALRTVGRSLTDEGVLDRSPGSLAQVFSSVANDLDAHNPICITDAAICNRILGYGRYEKHPSSRFVAGTSHRVSIYTELDHFGTRDVRSSDPDTMPGDTLAIEVSQTIVLFAGGVQAWSVAKQSVILPGRKLQRDLFLRQVIDLPANLTIGKYELKVIVRDETDNAIDEAILPVEIVAADR